MEYTYGVARIRSLESALFTDETMSALLMCKSYNECMDFLRDRGWGNGNPDQTLEKMLQEETAKAQQVIRELVEDESSVAILTINDEFHNLKAAIKQVCTEDETENIFYAHTKLDSEFLKECIRQGNFGKLPENMSFAAKEATDILLRTGNGQLCDIIIDHAALMAVRQAGLKAENSLIKKYADVQVTIADIKIAVRCAATGKDSRFVEKCVVPCEGISVTDLIRSVDSGLEGVCNYLESSGYDDAVKALRISKSVFECWCDNKIIEHIKPEKYNSFSIGPIVAYVIARQIEIKTVKIILSGKLNNFDERFIKERVRLMYA